MIQNSPLTTAVSQEDHSLRSVPKLIVETTPMLRDLMVAVLATKGVPRDVIEYRAAAVPPGQAGTPVGAFIQQGGMIALDHAGIDVPALIERSTTISRFAILNTAGSRSILEYVPALPDAGPLPIFVLLDDVREAVARAAAPPSPMLNPISPTDDSAAQWTSASCPGALTRVVSGRLRKPGSVILWTGPRVHIGIAPLPNGRLFAYAVSRRILHKDEERGHCATALDQAPACLASELVDVGEVFDESWFPLEQVGYRASRPPGTNVLRWGSSLLRLHPLTGQHLSYWAIQSAKLADDVARNGSISASFVAQLDKDTARIYEQHGRALGFNLAPSWAWRALRRPYALALRVTPPLRRHAVRRHALLDFLL